MASIIFNQYRGCLLVKNSFVNISEVNRQCLHSLGTRSEDDFEKVSSTNVHATFVNLILRRIWSYITEGLYITIYRMHN